MRSLKTQALIYTRVQWILGGIIVAAFVLFYAVAYYPQNRQLQAIQDQIRSRQRELQTNQSQASKLPRVREQVDRLRARLERFDKRMPPQPELGQFIRDINQISHRSSMRKLSVQPGATRKNDLFSEMPVNLSFEGDFLGIFAFLQQAEDMERLTRIRALSIHGKDMTRGDVEVRVSMNIYFAEGS